MAEVQELADEQLADEHKKVLEALIQSTGAMPFLELTLVSDVDDERLEEIIADLKRRRLVRVINPDDVVEKIITMTGEGYKVAKRKV